MSVPRTNTFECIRQKFCAKQSLDPAKVKFMFEGQALRMAQTPEDLDLEGDVRVVNTHTHTHTHTHTTKRCVFTRDTTM
ncbi:MAG: sumo domain-containing protein [Runella zeae]